jgi:hypothetical protein
LFGGTLYTTEIFINFHRGEQTCYIKDLPELRVSDKRVFKGGLGTFLKTLKADWGRS